MVLQDLLKIVYMNIMEQNQLYWTAMNWNHAPMLKAVLNALITRIVQWDTLVLNLYIFKIIKHHKVRIYPLDIFLFKHSCSKLK